MSYRAKCLRQKGRVCEECGSTENIEVHHINMNRWDNRIENLAPLCHECHRNVHSSNSELQEWTVLLDPEPYFGAPDDRTIDAAFSEMSSKTDSEKKDKQTNEEKCSECGCRAVLTAGICNPCSKILANKEQ